MRHIINCLKDSQFPFNILVGGLLGVLFASLFNTLCNVCYNVRVFFFYPKAHPRHQLLTQKTNNHWVNWLCGLALLLHGVTALGQPCATTYVTVHNTGGTAINLISISDGAGHFSSPSLTAMAGSILNGNSDTGALAVTYDVGTYGNTWFANTVTTVTVSQGGTNFTQTFTSGACSTTTSFDVYFISGPPPTPAITNQACLTLNNPGPDVVYYQFFQQYTDAGPLHDTIKTFTGCDSQLSYNDGSGAQSPPSGSPANDYFALYPGQTITVCSRDTNGGFNFGAKSVHGEAYPCGVTVGYQPRCVLLCQGDNVPFTGGSNNTPISSAVDTNGIPIIGGIPAANQITNFTATNGIDFPEGTTNLALESTLRTGFNSVVNQQSILQSLNAQEALLAHADSVALLNGINASLISNREQITLSNITLTNLAALTNLNNLTNFPTNYPNAQLHADLTTNQVATNMYGTNFANGQYTAGSNFGRIVGNLMSSNVGSVSAPASGSGTGGYDIPVPQFNAINGGHFAIGLAAIPTTGTFGSTLALLVVGKDVASWVICLGLFVSMLRHAKQSIDETMSQRQVQGSTQDVFIGVNASAATGVAYIGLIVSLIAAIPTAIASYIVTAHSNVDTYSGAFTSVSGNPIWDLMTCMIPVETIVTAFFSYFIFRFVVCMPLVYLVRGIIMVLLSCAVFWVSVTPCNGDTVSFSSGTFTNAPVYVSAFGTVPAWNAAFPILIRLHNLSGADQVLNLCNASGVTQIPIHIGANVADTGLMYLYNDGNFNALYNVTGNQLIDGSGTNINDIVLQLVGGYYVTQVHCVPFEPNIPGTDYVQPLMFGFFSGFGGGGLMAVIWMIRKGFLAKIEGTT